MLADLPGDHSWVLDLVAPDDGVRHRALARHQALLAAASDALDWSNEILARGGIPVSEPHLTAELDQARADLDWHRQQTVFGPIEAFYDSVYDNPAAREQYAPYVALYLRWEAAYPQEWGAAESWMWSPWSTKAGLLRRLDCDGVPEAVRSQVADLIVAALQRPYRCKDWMYAQLVRQVLDPPFAGRVRALRTAEDPLTCLRAQFIVHVAEHPDRPVRRNSWQRWLAADG